MATLLRKRKKKKVSTVQTKCPRWCLDRPGDVVLVDAELRLGGWLEREDDVHVPGEVAGVIVKVEIAFHCLRK